MIPWWTKWLARYHRKTLNKWLSAYKNRHRTTRTVSCEWLGAIQIHSWGKKYPFPRIATQSERLYDGVAPYSLSIASSPPRTKHLLFLVSTETSVWYFYFSWQKKLHKKLQGIAFFSVLDTLSLSQTQALERPTPASSGKKNSSQNNRTQSCKPVFISTRILRSRETSSKKIQSNIRLGGTFHACMRWTEARKFFVLCAFAL